MKNFVAYDAMTILYADIMCKRIIVSFVMANLAA